MSGPILYVTGTNTGVGKTTLAAMLLRRARERNIRVAAAKPFCSGGREDAETLHSLQTAGLTLDEVNPFHFEEPLTPLVAAQRAGRRVNLSDAIGAMTPALRSELPLLVEGAGGLLSPLGEGFSLFEIIQKIPGKACIVAPNVLGTLNSVLLTSRQLPVKPASQCVVLMTAAEPDLSAESNQTVLTSLLPGISIYEAPRLEQPKLETPRFVDQIIDWWTVVPM